MNSEVKRLVKRVSVCNSLTSFYEMSFLTLAYYHVVLPIILNDSRFYFFSFLVSVYSHCLSSFLFFFLIAPPVFTQKPFPVGALKGSDVILQCEISGTPPFEVVWVKDRKQVRSSKKFKITSKNFDTSLHILSLEPSDIGEYHCKATNEVGSDTCACTVKFKGLYTWAQTYPFSFHLFLLE